MTESRALNPNSKDAISLRYMAEHIHPDYLSVSRLFISPNVCIHPETPVVLYCLPGRRIKKGQAGVQRAEDTITGEPYVLKLERLITGLIQNDIKLPKINHGSIGDYFDSRVGDLIPHIIIYPYRTFILGHHRDPATSRDVLGGLAIVLNPGTNTLFINTVSLDPVWVNEQIAAQQKRDDLPDSSVMHKSHTNDAQRHIHPEKPKPPAFLNQGKQSRLFYPPHQRNLRTR